MWYNGFEVKSVNKQQTHKERVSRQSRDLQFGDIVGICAPFEENLPDYYNGYNPLDVRGDYVTDGFGRTYKFRPVMVVGVSWGKRNRIALRTDYTSQYCKMR